MIYLASDHAGFELKEKVKKSLQDSGFNVEDCGAYKFDPNDDYPDFVSKAAKKVSEDLENSKAIIFGGSGQAEAMVANKFPGVRCALFYAAVAPVEAADITGRKSEDPFEMIRLTREHNDANILSIGARFVTEENAQKAAKFWLEQKFSKDERHVRRHNKISNIEASNG
ncbi:MAG: RpiB/LacA/LacB family sugar-phosphate isomerase [Candidatus Woykebacteria bacterium]